MSVVEWGRTISVMIFLGAVIWATALIDRALARRDAEIARLREALEGIDQFGHRHPGHGWSCGELARAALKETPDGE